MLKLLRYTLAAIFLAASVGCLGLWWRSFGYHEAFVTPGRKAGESLCLVTATGWGNLVIQTFTEPYPRWAYESKPLSLREGATLQLTGAWTPDGVTLLFPLWYAALVFALAAVGALRLGKPFTIRSALVATAVVAGLLGVVVAL